MPSKNPTSAVLVVPQGSIVHAVWRKKNADADPIPISFIAGLRIYRRLKTPPGQVYDGHDSIAVPFNSITRIDAAADMAVRDYMIRFRLANPAATVQRKYDLELVFCDQNGNTLSFDDGTTFLDFEDTFTDAVEILCALNV